MRESFISMAYSIALAVTTFTGFSAGQTGSITPTSVQLDAIPIDESAKLELIEEPVIDLRAHLPSVGEQKINDCTAWAAAYAKSYAEAREQGWKPDSPSRVFSPSFLYNQVNHGRDKGSNILDVVNLMASKGAATLARAPYTPGDFLAPPSLIALAEASAYPIANAYRLTNQTAIRRALQRRSVVVIGTHVGPLFMGGKYSVYTRELFTRDETLRQPGQPHGKHAMLIVGYDDSKKAFLIQNSWGTRWALGGYCYASYDLFDEIRPTGADKSDGVFCNWALVMNDVDEPIEFDAKDLPKPKGKDVWELKPGGFADITGFDSERKRFQYTFVATLRGPRETTAKVKSVEWRWNDDKGNAQRYLAENPGDRFSVVGTADTSPVQLKGLVRLANGDAYDIQGELPGQSPKAEFRTATPVFKDRYWGRKDDGTPLFDMRMTMDVPLAERNQIKEVVYTCNGKSSSYPGYADLSDYGPVTWYTPGPMEVDASIHYVDGGVKKVHFTAPITDDVHDGRRILSSSRKISQTADGRSVYSVTLAFDRPSKDDFKIARVEYFVGPHFAEPTLVSVDTFGQYEVFLTTDRDFRVRMTVFEDFQGQKKQESIEQWISVGPETKFSSPANIELVAADTYLGRAWGVPIRRSEVRLIGDFKTLERIARVNYTLPDHLENKSQVITREMSPTFSLNIDDSRPFTIQAVATLDDGSTLPFSVTHTPSALINDNRSLSVAAEAKPTFWIDSTQPMRSTLNVRPVGAPHELWNTRTVKYRGVFDGVPFDHQLDLDKFRSPDDALFGCAPRSPMELEAVITDHQDFEQSIRVNLVPGISRDQLPALSLRVREKLWSCPAEGPPQWIARIDLCGTEADLAGLKSATISLTHIDDDVPFENIVLNDDLSRELAYLVSRPTRVVAQLSLADGTTRQLDSLVRAESATLEPLQLRVRQRVSGYPETVVETHIHLTGQEESMRNVKTVAYQLAGEAVPTLVDRRESWSDGDFVLTLPRPLEGDVIATITMIDGTTRTLKAVARPRERPLSYFVRTFPGKDMGKIVIGHDGWPYLFNDFNWGDDVDLDYHSPLDWIAFPANALVFDATPASTVHLSRVRSFLNGASIDLPGRDIRVPPSSANLTAECVPHPVRRNEWITRLAGPMEIMARVKATTYRVNGKPAHITQRWGETSDAFELRHFGERPPKIQANVELDDGSTIEIPISTQPN